MSKLEALVLRDSFKDGSISEYSRKGESTEMGYFADSRWINEQLGVNDSYQAPNAMWEILYNKEVREQVIRNFLKEYDGSVDYDWFLRYFQEEHADRKEKKQDFTPKSIAQLLSEITLGDSEEVTSLIMDAPAGTGSLLINRWSRERYKSSPFDYKPGWYLHVAEDLSDRAIPFLIFNLIARGMNAVVAHCDVLSRECFGVFFIQNDKDDHMMFSNLNLIPYPENTPLSNEKPLNWFETESVTLLPGLEYKFTHQMYKSISESKGEDGLSAPSYLMEQVTNPDYFKRPFTDIFSKYYSSK